MLFPVSSVDVLASVGFTSGRRVTSGVSRQKIPFSENRKLDFLPLSHCHDTK